MTEPAQRRRRLVAAALVPLAAVGGYGLLGAAPADAVVADQTVVSGEARFQVLSPTLIRTEYAGDGAFTDEGTFNVVGRDDFEPTPYTSEVVDGWLVVDTGEVELRYREGSGSFTEENLSVRLITDSGQHVDGRPWVQQEDPACAAGALCEAEELTLTGLSLATNHPGYTGAGFAAGFESEGNALAFATTVEGEGDRELAVRYANSQGGDGQVAPRTLTVAIDGDAAQTIELAPTDGWDDWTLARFPIAVPEGEHRVTLERRPGDSGQVNLDSLALIDAGAAYPDPAEPAPADCAFGAICEAETGAVAGGAAPASDHNGASGDAFAAGLGQGASHTTHVTGVPAAGEYALQVRYANALADSGVAVSTGAGTEASVALPVTSGWDYWRTVSVPVALTAGEDDVVLSCPEGDGCQVNIDTVALTAADSPLLAPHAALGGYRRDLDTANGTVPTNPGLLFQDGWSLLDDTASSLYDPASDVLTPRDDHGSAGYQDGYVFGYGDDHRQALADLRTLTGPTALLPRWAYGVWYSEYYDRTADDFTDVILPRFREEGVPVDVMAIDTDYKSPDKWNGWEVDTTRFPDMGALLAELEAEGVHNTLNIHPTISADDPKLAAAQEIAGGALTLSGNGEDYLFDWSDPAQLEAYFDLHDDTKTEGTDLWWLDWCCSEGSSYSAAGVTPDAYINSRYAAYSDAALEGRGFAFSRAYGSLTAGGYGNPQPVATGPWADKRTTLHFTGDTTSTWQMLQAQVGYTPGESAATGLAAISHDIGGHTGGETFPGAEPESTQLADDLYARWVQFGTFQPIDRLHSNHSDRLPWQYGPAAEASAAAFLNLRENLMPLTYTLAAEATATGTPMLRPLYLDHPGSQEAYAMAGREYLYGSDVLVAPVTTPGETATTTVWFPEGADWTDWFTGETHAGGTTADVTTGLDRMPVFVRAGGIVPTRSADVANDSTAPADELTLTVTTGADGAFELYEDDGTSPQAATPTSADPAATAVDGSSATTAVEYTQRADGGTLAVAAPSGSYDGQPAERAWTAVFRDADEPVSVSVDGSPVSADAWRYDSATRSITVSVPARPVTSATEVAFSTTAAAVPQLAVDRSPIAAGETQIVRGTGFPAGAEVALSSDPDIGTASATADASGAFRVEFPIPADFSGDVDVIAEATGTTASIAFTVTAAEAPPAGSDPPAGDADRDGDLAYTGPAIGLLLAAGITALVLGSVLLARRRLAGGR